MLLSGSTRGSAGAPDSVAYGAKGLLHLQGPIRKRRRRKRRRGSMAEQLSPFLQESTR